MKNIEFNQLNTNLLEFIHRIEGIKVSFPIVCSTIESEFKKNYDDLSSIADFINDKEHGILTIKIPLQSMQKFGTLRFKGEGLARAQVILPRNFLISLISQYDGFISQLIKCLFLLNPKKLNSSKKEIKYCDLLNFENIDEVRNYLIDEEINTVLRENHFDQIYWLGKKIGCSLSKDEELIKKLIEITERRNLFVHNNGTVNRFYIKNCKDKGVHIDKNIEIGDQLHVNENYFFDACDCICEIATKLTYIVWRRLGEKSNEEIENADQFFNTICYRFIEYENYSLALKLLEFGTSRPNIANQRIKIMMKVNKAQSHKWLGESERMEDVLNSQDWSSLSNSFILAKLVLQDDFDEAAKIMMNIPEKKIRPIEYGTWPLFKEFRKSTQFLKHFRKKFGHEYFPINPKEEKDNQIDRNVQRYSLTYHLVSVLIALWNQGEIRSLSPSEIRDICGNGAYGNHRKLSYPAWDLVEDDPTSKKRKLTRKGIEFIEKNISVHRNLIQNKLTGTFEPADDVMVKITDYEQN